MTGTWNRVRRDESGSLVFVVIASIVAGGLMVVLFNYARGAIVQARIDRDFTHALPVAESGLELALTDLRQGQGDAVSQGGTLYSSWAEGTVGGSVYRYQAWRVDTTTWEVRAEGCAMGPDVSTFSDCDAGNGRIRTLEALAERTAFFWLAAFGDTAATFPGNNAVITMPGLPADVPTDLAQVGSNGEVLFQGNAYAEGVTLYGSTSQCVHRTSGGDRSCEFDTDGDGTADTPLLRETESRDIAAMFDRDDFESRCPPSEGPYEPFSSSQFGGVVPPHPDGYYCASSVWFDVPTTINATADDPVIIYTEGDVRVPLLPGTGVNCDPLVCTTNGPDLSAGDPPDPRTLQIYVSGSASNVEFNPNTYFAGAIFAPGATCDGLISNASVEYYGSLICGELLNVGGWSFYFDPRLVEVGSDRFRVTEWREEVGGSTSIP